MAKILRINFLIIGFILAHISFGQYSGNYSVGGSSPDFKTLDSAFFYLSKKGISGNVRLNVRSGTYYERIMIKKVKGASYSNRIKVAPDPNNSAPVIFKKNMPSTDSNFIFKVGQGYIEFDSLEFVALKPSKYGTIINFMDTTLNVTFNGCSFQGLDTAFAYLYAEHNILTNSSTRGTDSLKILNCTFTGGVRAIFLRNFGSSYLKGVVIEANKFYRQAHESVNVQTLVSAKIIKNYVENKATSDRGSSGFSIASCVACLTMENKIIIKNAGYGIMVFQSASSFTNPPQIVNNAISLLYEKDTALDLKGGTGTGLYIDNGNELLIYNNTILVNSRRGYGVNFGFKKGGKQNCKFKNNLIVNDSGGMAAYFTLEAKDAISEMDYNNFYTDGPYLASIYSHNWFSDIIADLSEIQKIFGKDSHSISAKVKFKSNTDLSTFTYELDSAGVSLSNVTTDVEGNKRNPKKPDIGAHEFTYLDHDIGITKLYPADFPDCGLDSTVAGVIIKNRGLKDQKNFTVSFDIKSDSNFSWSGSTNYTKTLKSNTSDTLIFKKFNTRKGGRYTFKALLNLSSDEFRENDTLSLLKVLRKSTPKPMAGFDTVCSNQAYTLGIRYPVNTIYKWYTASNGGKLISDKPTIAIKDLKRDTAFYITSKSANIKSDFIKTRPGAQLSECSTRNNGFFFEVIPKINLNIDSLASYFHHSPTVPQFATLYYKKGSSYGFEDKPNKWTRIDSISLKTSYDYQLLNIPLKKPFALMKDTLYSFYLYCTFPRANLNNDLLTPVTYSNSDLTLNLKSSTCSYFKDWKSYTLVGSLHYSKVVECESERVPYKVKAVAPPKVNLGKDTSICDVGSFNHILNAGTGFKKYTWSTADTLQKISINKLGTYWVKVFDARCYNSDTITISNFLKIKLNIGKDTAYCEKNGINYNLNAGSGFKTYQWNTGVVTQTLNVKSDGKYSVKVVDKNNCEGFDTVVVKKNTDPIVSLGNDTSYCIENGAFIQLNAGKGYKAYKWSTTETQQHINIFKNGYYEVEVTDSNNCKGKGAVTLTFYPKLKINLGNDTSFCTNTSFNIFLDPGPGFLYSWSTGANTQSISVTKPGKYFVDVSNFQKCRANDTLIVTLNPIPKVNLGPDRLLNPDFPIDEILDAGPGFKAYEWSTSEKTQTIKVTMEGTYSVKATDDKGCVGNDTIGIKLAAKGSISILENKPIQIYPNPASEILKIVSESRTIQKIEVFDIHGKSIMSREVGEHQFLLNTSVWASGMYFISIYTNGTKYNLKFTVQN